MQVSTLTSARHDVFEYGEVAASVRPSTVPKSWTGRLNEKIQRERQPGRFAEAYHDGQRLLVGVWSTHT
jgi:hypothetical protein